MQLSTNVSLSGGVGLLSGERVTIRKVAQTAGVSIATVSRVFAGSETVSEVLRERVREAARTLDYTPHAVAQSLALGRTLVVGLLVPNLANPAVCRLIKRVMQQAQQAGYRLIIADADENSDAEPTLGSNLLQRTDGLVLVSPRADTGTIAALADQNKPLVVVNRPVESVGLCNVLVDDFGAMCQLADHVAGLGHRRVAYLHGPTRSWEAARRLEAVETTLGGRGVEMVRIDGAGTLEDGQHAVPQVLAARCTAVMTYNDLMAFGVLGALHERGLRVPEDISVSGFDDVPFARCVSPTLTTATGRQQEVGTLAWAALHGLLDGGPPPATEVLTAEPVFRGSTAAAPPVG